MGTPNFNTFWKCACTGADPDRLGCAGANCYLQASLAGPRSNRTSSGQSTIHESSHLESADHFFDLLRGEVTEKVLFFAMITQNLGGKKPKLFQCHSFEKLHALLLMLCVSVLSFLQERLLAAPSTDDAAHMDHMDPSSHIAGQPTSRRGMVRASGWWCHMC